MYSLVQHTFSPFGKVSEWWRLSVPANCISLASALAQHDGKNGCFPSIDRLITVTGLSRRTIYYQLAKLESAGIITRKRSRYATNYEVHYHLRSAIPCTPEVQSIAPRSATGCTSTYIKDNRTDQSPTGGERSVGNLPEMAERVLRKHRVRAQDPGDSRPASGSTPQRRSAPHDLELLKWFAQTFIVRYDGAPNFFKAAKALIAIYGDGVYAACRRAAEMRAKLCEDGSRFTISKVLYYARVYDRSLDGLHIPDEAEQARIEQLKAGLQRQIDGYSTNGTRKYIIKNELDRAFVGKYHPDWAEYLFDKDRLREINELDPKLKPALRYGAVV